MTSAHKKPALLGEAHKGAVAGLTFAAGFWAGLLFLSNLDKLIPQKGLR